MGHRAGKPTQLHAAALMRLPIGTHVHNDDACWLLLLCLSMAPSKQHGTINALQALNIGMGMLGTMVGMFPDLNGWKDLNVEDFLMMTVRTKSGQRIMRPARAGSDGPPVRRPACWCSKPC